MANPASVLVVDDMPDFRSLLRLILTTKGKYDVIEARDGHEALQQARQHRPNLVILDYMMPDMDGPTVCRELRADPHTSAIPVLMVTARSADNTRQEAFEAGVTAFMPKPVKPRDLLDEVARLLSSGAAVG